MATVDSDTLKDARAFLWHQTHRSRCHYARRDDCECQACEGHLHKGGGIGLLDIPPELLAQLEREAQPERKATPRTPGPRRRRRNSAQLSMLLIT